MFDSLLDETVLGIDPGLSACGYGAVRRAGDSFVAVASGAIRTERTLPLENRLADLEGAVADLVADLRPIAMVVERVLFQANARTAISVGQASGVALAVAARAGVPVVQYSPNEVKLAVAGDGGADKREVQEMVARLLGLANVPKPADAADALALALCHAWKARLDRAVAAGAGAKPPPVPAGGAVPTSSSALSARIDAALARDAAAGRGSR